MNNEILLILIGMAIVTYVPRMLPLVVFQNMNLPPFWQNVLKNVPYATLGALIIPAVFFIQEDILFGIIGAVTALIVAYIGANAIIVVMSSIAVLCIYSVFF